jgi:hypothetical protein
VGQPRGLSAWRDYLFPLHGRQAGDLGGGGRQINGTYSEVNEDTGDDKMSLKEIVNGVMSGCSDCCVSVKAKAADLDDLPADFLTLNGTCADLCKTLPPPVSG